MERLEEMLLLSYTVTNTNDSGPGSLRFEINSANAAGVAATIDFQIPGSGPITIAVGSTSAVALPTIQVPLTIDGWSEGTFQGDSNPTAHPWIVLDGFLLTGAQGLDVANGPGSVIQGLSVVNFHYDPATLSGGNGIIVEGPSTGVLIQGDNIGVGADGTTAAGNDVSGIALFSTDATVGGTTAAAGDVISGNGDGPLGQGAGVFVSSTPFIGPTATGNIIEGDKIGTDVTGATAIANNYGVVLAGAVGATVGGAGAAAANLISGNVNAGVYLTSNGFGIVPSEPTSGNLVAGNTIGTDTTGTKALGNGLDGVMVDGGAAGNAIDGGNLIAGNGQNGVELNGATTSGNLVAGNLIGTDTTGTKAIPNATWGVLVPDAPGNTVGGTTAAARNVISGNSQGGVAVYGPDANGNLVEGNFIGTDVTGTLPLGNAFSGVYVGDGSGFGPTFPGSPSNVTVGGSVAGAGNIIAANQNWGVWVNGGAGDLVQGDFIGTDPAGDTGLGNQFSAVFLGGGSTGSTVDTCTLSASVAGDGLTIAGSSGNSITNDTIGRTPASAVYNGYSGVSIYTDGTFGPSVANTLSGDVIIGNLFDGVSINGAGTSGNVVEGDLIGTDSAGDSFIGNGFDGVFISGGADANTVSNSTISGNLGDGVGISGSSNNTLTGDVIGLTPAGNVALGNSNAGIDIFTDGNGVGSTSNMVLASVVAANGVNGYAGVIINGVGTSGNVVQGSLVGTDAAGDAGLGNQSTGVAIFGGATANTIGGATTVVAGTIGTAAVTPGDTISGNTNSGVSIFDVGTTGNVVQGDLIGLDPTGALALANTGDGVLISGGASSNTVEGGAIGGNGFYGVQVTGQGTDQNLVENALIGTNAAGTGAVGNTFSGVLIDSGAASNRVQSSTISGNGGDGVSIVGAGNNSVTASTIGLAADNSTALGNADSGVSIFTDGSNVGATGNLLSDDIIAANGSQVFTGVSISGPGTSGNVVENSTIGTDAADDAGLGNTGGGLSIFGGATGNSVESNRISGNTGAGVAISGVGTTGNVLTGNFIGTTAAGNGPLPNTGDGIAIFAGATGNTIGGTGPGDMNLISGNGFSGVTPSGAGTSGNLIEGNFIGTDVTGKLAVPNTFDGIGVFGGTGSNTIRGNLVSGNNLTGISISDAGSDGYLIINNTVGTNFLGTAALPNGEGIAVVNGASDETIQGNLASGNSEAGIILEDGSGDLIVGNTVGTDVTGTKALGNAFQGIFLGDVSNSTIGGTTAAARNLVSGNTINGIAVVGGGSTSVLIQGNYVGTDVTGTAAIPNGADGIQVGSGSGFVPPFAGSASGVTIQGNLVSGNTLNGIGIDGVGASSIVVAGNRVGTDVTGTKALGNTLDGILVSDGASGDTIGGTSPTAANVISGNLLYGIHLRNAGTSGNLVEGNLIGADASGTKPLGNGNQGVLIDTGAIDNTIGGTTTSDANVIAANALEGVRISDLGTTGNVVEGNFIGTDPTGTIHLGNTGDGVAVVNSASNDTVGGTASGAGNVIAFNGGNGVTIGSSKTDAVVGDSVLTNDIFSNTKIGIDLADDGVTLNDSAGHAGPNLFQDLPVLTRVDSGASTGTFIQGTVAGAPNTTLRVEFFINTAADPTGYGQGQSYVGFALVPIGMNGVGTILYHIATALPVGQFLTATATDPDGNTSEFSKAIPVTPAPAPSYALSVTGYRYNRSTHQFLQFVTITNTGPDPILGPISFVLDNLTTGVTLANATGTTTTGSPYIDFNLSGNELLPNQGATVLLQFNDPTNVQIRYDSRLILGPGPR
jgi:parallel beta-helix repeat protein